MKNLIQLLTLLLLTQTSYAQTAVKTAPLSDEKFSFNVEVIGDHKESILFIPGFSCAGAVWNETVAQFRTTHSCHVLTMPGFAGIPAEEDPNWKSWKTDVANYIQENKLVKTTIVGHSMGGMLALDLASEFPDLIGKIVVVDALPALSALYNPNFEAQETPNCQPMIDMMLSQSSEQFSAMQMTSVGSMCQTVEKQKDIVAWAMESDRKTLGKMYCELTNLDLRNQLDKITCPTLVLLETPFKAIETKIESQYDKLEGVQLNYAPKGLHFIMFDAPEWYAAQLATFLK